VARIIEQDPMQSLTFRRPSDLHVHFRDSQILEAVVPFTARAFATAIVMPNLVPPVQTAAEAAAYRNRIKAAVPEGVQFEPRMTCYLTDQTDHRDLLEGHKAETFAAAKLYPAHATTNSAHGVTSIDKLQQVLETMQDCGMPLLVHGEVARRDVDIFDREKVFIDEILLPTLRRYPRLRVVLEHITTKEGADVASSFGDRLAATITPQHLLFNRNALFDGGLRPHMYCLPVLKREMHRAALRKAATSGLPNYFLGTDTAPHFQHLKETDCGCAGVFSAPVAVEAYLQVFEEEDALDKFENFASIFGPQFYGFEPSSTLVTYVKQPRHVPATSQIGNAGSIKSLFANEEVAWSLAS
jgi:dihydroorotase